MSESMAEILQGAGLGHLARLVEPVRAADAEDDPCPTCGAGIVDLRLNGETQRLHFLPCGHQFAFTDTISGVAWDNRRRRVKLRYRSAVGGKPEGRQQKES